MDAATRLIIACIALLPSLGSASKFLVGHDDLEPSFSFESYTEDGLPLLLQQDAALSQAQSGWSTKFYRLVEISCPYSVNFFEFDAMPAAVSRIDSTINYAQTTDPWTGLSFSDHYAAQWLGVLTIKEAGDYTFATSSSDGSTLVVDGKTVVNNDGCHAMQRSQGSISLTAGTHSVAVSFFETNETAGLTVSYNGPDTNSKETVIPSDVISVPTTTTTTTTTTITITSTKTTIIVTTTETTTVTTTIRPNTTTTTTETTTTTVASGFIATFYNVKRSCPIMTLQETNLATKTPFQTRHDPMINYAPSDWKGLGFDSNTIAVQWQGTLSVTRASSYIFATTANAGSLVLIDGITVVSNDGCNPTQRVEGKTFLSSGVHAVTVQFFGMNGSATINFTYSGADSDDVEVLVSGAAITPKVTPITTTTTTITTVTTVTTTTTTTIRTTTITTTFANTTLPTTITTTTVTTTSTAVTGFIVGYYNPPRSCPLLTLQGTNLGAPFKTRTDLSINHTEKDFKQLEFSSGTYAAQWQGTLTITAGSTYVFATSSNSGSRVLIDDQVVVNNDGCHALQRIEGRTFLSAGVHAVTVQFFGASNATINFTYSGADTDNVEVLVSGAAILPKVTVVTTTTVTTTTPLTTTTHTVTVTRTSTVTQTVTQTTGNTTSGTTSTVTTTSTTTVLGGFTAKFYPMMLNCPFNATLLDFSTFRPAVTRVDPVINYASGTEPWSGLTYADRFAAWWTGFLNVIQPGLYTFATTSDEGSLVTIDGQRVVTNDGCHAMRRVQGQVALTVGLRSISVVYFETDGPHGITLTYSGPDTGEIEIIVPSRVMIPSTTTTTAPPGWVAQFYKMEIACPWNLSFVSLETLSPTVRRLDLAVNYSDTLSNWSNLTFNDHYVAQWTGLLTISTPGRYTFSTSSDGGSIVTIDGQTVVNNDGCHDYRREEGLVTLTAGGHLVNIRFFETNASAGIVFTYSGPDTGNAEAGVPSTVVAAQLTTTTTTTTTVTTTTMTTTTVTTTTETTTSTTVTSTRTTITTTTTTTRTRTVTTTTTTVLSGFKAQFYKIILTCPFNATRLDFSTFTPDVVRLDQVINYTSGSWQGLLYSDRFAVQWTGLLAITTPGSYLFSTSSDEGSLVTIDGDLVVNNDGCHRMTRATGQVNLAAGWKRISVVYFDTDGPDGITLTYNGPDTTYSEVLVTGSVVIPEFPTTTTTTAPPGFVAQFYKMEIECPFSLEWISLEDKKPAVERIDLAVNYSNTRGNWTNLTISDHFLARWTGLLTIVTSGTYTFTTSSDAGSVVYIDGKKIVDNDGCHAYQSASGTVNLTAGGYHLQVRFFETTATAGIVFTYNGPDTDDLDLIVPSTVVAAQLTTITTTTTTTTTSTRTTSTSTITTSTTSTQTRTKTSTATVTVTTISTTGTFTTTVTGQNETTTIQTTLAATTPAATAAARTTVEDTTAAATTAEPTTVADTTAAATTVRATTAAATTVAATTVTATIVTTTTTTLGTNGLNVKFYQLTINCPGFSLSAFNPDSAGLASALSRQDAQINYPNTNQPWSGLSFSDSFAAQWTGFLNIKKGGSYKFTTASDAGSMVIIDGATVISGVGGCTRTFDSPKTSSEQTLSSGSRALVVRYFENTGLGGITFSYSGPDTNGETIIVPSSALSTVRLS